MLLLMLFGTVHIAVVVVTNLTFAANNFVVHQSIDQIDFCQTIATTKCFTKILSSLL